MLKYKNFCMIEARRNPELNPKISAYEFLKEYKNRDDIYISFTDLEKIGIKPLSNFNTPNGIYTYPLKEVWREYNVEQNKSFNQIPFAGDRPFINILEVKPTAKFVELSKYSSKNYDDDRNELLNMLIKNLKNESLAVKTFQMIEDKAIRGAKRKTPAYGFWNLTRIISNNYQKEYGIKSISGTQAWNNLLRRLGYDGFSDKRGMGIIHILEPMQAVFLHKAAFKTIDRVENKDYILTNQFSDEDLKKIFKTDGYIIPEFTKSLSALTLKITKATKLAPLADIEKAIFKNGNIDACRIVFENCKLKNVMFDKNYRFNIEFSKSAHFENCKFSNFEFTYFLQPALYFNKCEFHRVLWDDELVIPLNKDAIFENCKIEGDIDYTDEFILYFKNCSIRGNIPHEAYYFSNYHNKYIKLRNPKNTQKDIESFLKENKDKDITEFRDEKFFRELEAELFG